MTRRTIFRLVLMAWLAMFALSFIVPAVTAPTDFGMTRGLNRVSLFFQFQAMALVLAIAAWISTPPDAGRGMRWLGRVPGLVAVLGLAMVAGLILWAHLRPYPVIDNAPTPKATTPAPATD